MKLAGYVIGAMNIFVAVSLAEAGNPFRATLSAMIAIFVIKHAWQLK